ncbi:LOW QUALITY PROTEIN: uncharacterized protein ACR2FA_009877 [Aphomia sociella]
MFKKSLFLVSLCTGLVCAKDPELPPCPTNVEYFPQNLPMHCRMPRHASYPFPDNMLSVTMPPFPPAPPFPPPGPYYQNSQSDKEGGPLSIPMPPGIPGPMPVPMPMPMVAPGPAHKLPVIVMPFYSPERSYKKPPHENRRPPKRIVEIHTRRPSYYSDTDTSSDTDTDTSSDTSSNTSSEGRGWWKGKGWRRNGRRFNKRHKSRRKKHNKKDLLTPILQYVTKDGYVIFEKKITKGEAKDWLSVKKAAAKGKKNPEKEQDSNDYEEPDEEHKTKSKEVEANKKPQRIVANKKQRKANILKTNR